MLKSLLIAAMLTASPASMQTPRSPIKSDYIDNDGWKYDLDGIGCTMTHIGGNGQPDLLLRGDARLGGVGVVLVLPQPIPFPAPVQFRVVAQTKAAQQFARVTFKPVPESHGTGLVALWPYASLIKLLAAATRLDFYASDRRLIHSVHFSAQPKIVEAYDTCLGQSDEDNVTNVSPEDFRNNENADAMADNMEAEADAYLPDDAGNSLCQGYWLGNGFGVAVTGDEKHFDLALMLKVPRPGYANPLTGPLGWQQTSQGGTDYVGGIDKAHVDAAFANLGSVSMACQANTATDDEGGPMKRVSEADYRRATASWPHS